MHVTALLVNIFGSFFHDGGLKYCLQIRYIGLSNETPYGLMKFLHVAEGGSRNARIVSVQVLYGSTLFENSEASPIKSCVCVCIFVSTQFNEY